VSVGQWSDKTGRGLVKGEKNRVDSLMELRNCESRQDEPGFGCSSLSNTDSFFTDSSGQPTSQTAPFWLLACLGVLIAMIFLHRPG
jgi:hypothetical protein